MRTLHKIEHKKGRIIVTIREWEGVGTPDYYTLEYFDVDSALWVRDTLNTCILEAKKYDEEFKLSRIKNLENEIQMRQEELAKLKG